MPPKRCCLPHFPINEPDKPQLPSAGDLCMVRFVGQLPRKEVRLMEQFLRDVLVAVVAGIIVAVVVRLMGL